MSSFALEYVVGPECVREKLVLRVYSGDDTFSKAANEISRMDQIFKAGYTVPSIHILERDDSFFHSTFIIIDHIEGQVMWLVLLCWGIFTTLI